MATDDERMASAIAEFYGTCPACGNRIARNLSGVLRRHGKRDEQGSAASSAGPCAGSGKRPAPTAEPTP